ncbi:MAG: plasmid replication protein RepC [Cypionkella sp.]
MQHTPFSPVLRHVRRPDLTCPKPPAAEKDRRWILLDLAKTCRQRLKLRDRDIAVLRGLLSLMPAQARADQMVVFASNRVLIDRCDGIDERTLRRRIAHLQSVGMLVRRTSPNGKRYQLRDEHHQAQLTYGIDLAPLFHAQTELEALADDCHREKLRLKLLQKKIRDVLFHTASDPATTLQLEAQRALRRTLSSAQLQQILTALEGATPIKLAEVLQNPEPVAKEVTATDGQNDRHIQRSNINNLESESAENKTPEAKRDLAKPARQDESDISVEECLTLAKTAQTMSLAPPKSWEDLIDLSATLAPAIGLQKDLVHQAEKHLGRHGCALAVLGLVEAFGRIRNPEAYLAALIKRQLTQGLNLVGMFRSLVKPAQTAGLYA